MDERDLVKLMRAAIAGDERAYAELLRFAAASIRAFARRKISHGGIDPEDIVQETLLALHVKRHTWDEGAPVRPWLFAIARHKIIDAFRRKGRRIEIAIDELAETLEDEPQAESLSDREIERALSCLPPGQRAVVSAVSVEGRSIGETAGILMMSETAVRVALHRGLKAIAQRFGRS